MVSGVSLRTDSSLLTLQLYSCPLLLAAQHLSAQSLAVAESAQVVCDGRPPPSPQQLVGTAVKPFLIWLHEWL